ncbi:hypothetical protein [Couchioplanes azureus]|uniref:hypothetical protein n=1 Tax=Couchioplanes caeruleus TaxID=56438 RepID=UPI0016711F8A|nr:hypothetical protein [Couchioplanes caeruleus]GGQ39861.1 hypothetical protein GCM10010166_03450 [Couchioplanes caeruleus subsp. azureus]
MELRREASARAAGIVVSLTGIPLLALAGLAVAGFVTATVLLWSRCGRWRLLVRTLGVLLIEVAVVLCVGLAVNRSEQFYPSWAALAGDTGTTTTTAATQAGELDGSLAARSRLQWHPAGLPQWKLAAAPTMTVPSDYSAASNAPYPVLVVLGPATSVTAPAPGVVTVTLTPTPSTTAEALRTLVPDLSRAVRVTASGWAVVAGRTEAALAGDLVRSLPAQFRALAWAQESVAAFPGALGRIPPGTTVAAVRPTAAGRSAKPPPGVTFLTAAPPKAWPTAVTWATRQLSPPLAPPLQLPTGNVK